MSLTEELAQTPEKQQGAPNLPPSKGQKKGKKKMHFFLVLYIVLGIIWVYSIGPYWHPPKVTFYDKLCRTVQFFIFIVLWPIYFILYLFLKD